MKILFYSLYRIEYFKWKLWFDNQRNRSIDTDNNKQGRKSLLVSLFETLNRFSWLENRFSRDFNIGKTVRTIHLENLFNRSRKSENGLIDLETGTVDLKTNLTYMNTGFADPKPGLANIETQFRWSGKLVKFRNNKK